MIPLRAPEGQKRLARVRTCRDSVDPTGQDARRRASRDGRRSEASRVVAGMASIGRGEGRWER